MKRSLLLLFYEKAQNSTWNSDNNQLQIKRRSCAIQSFGSRLLLILLLRWVS